MRETRDIMGMPVTIEICDADASQAPLAKAFDYFRTVDERFSTYKKESEISRINRGEVSESQYSPEMKDILRLAEETRRLTDGYFEVKRSDGSIDPSGIVKGWAIQHAAQLLRSLGYNNIYVEAGGDIQTAGKNADGAEWRIGIRNPFNAQEIIKVVFPRGRGIATSGTTIRGAHIYDPHTKKPVETDLVSLTVIGPNVFEADRFATAAFAMGQGGIGLISHLVGFEGYAIDAKGMATMTEGFSSYTYDQNN
ncbi:MAG TPA: FAD:protein FMN transferase [Candidatus Paceibacterota bacterium]|jgi:thiamine biosynthesis lipoprotein|nr:FAD:protein FMN transferase [Candidatus Paceibacterota bacterium]